MTLSKDINAYSHIKNVLDSIPSGTTVIYELASPGRAHRWRMEAHAFRRLINAIGNHKYDMLVFRVQGASVEIASRLTSGTLRTLTGEVIPVAPPALTIVDPLEAEVEALNKKLFGDVDPLADFIPESPDD